MANYIFINREPVNDHISIFYDEPAFIVVANKDDLQKINSLEESHKPGIYLLLGDNKRYVGQASNSIVSRLQQHNINKNWWNKLIFFGREDKRLSKAQLDLLENKLIKQMSLTNFDLDNSTQGNHSYIDKLSKTKADTLLSKVEDTLSDIANINLFDSDYPQKGDSIDTINETGNAMVKFNNKKYSASSCRQIFIDIMVDLVNSDLFERLAPVISNAEPSTIYLLGNLPKVSNNGTKLTRSIENTPYHLYVNFSKADLMQKLKMIAKLTKQEIFFKIW